MNNFLKYSGIILMILGVIVILSAIPIVSQNIVSIGGFSFEVSELSATRIAVGVVLFFLGITLYKNS